MKEEEGRPAPAPDTRYPTPALEWLFFDVGNVLMNEDTWISRFRDRLIELFFEAAIEVDPGLPHARFQEVLEHAIRDEAETVEPLLAATLPTMAQRDSLQAFLARRVLAVFVPDDTARQALLARRWDTAIRAFYDLCEPAEGIVEVLEALKPRYRLGIIANQHPAIHPWMARYDLNRHFAMACYDCDLGFAKPDPRIFTHALEHAGCAPDRSVMIGDRPVNDIGPARTLGLWTIRVRAFGDFLDEEPSHEMEVPHVTVTDVRAIPDAIAELERRRSFSLLPFREKGRG